MLEQNASSGLAGPMQGAVTVPPPRQIQTDLTWNLDEAGEGDDASERDRCTRNVRNVAAQLGRHLRENRIKLPMLPQAATEALQLAGDPKTSFRAVERVVSGDPLLAARVLAVANSPAYGGHNVKNLALALQRLGTGTIRDILYQAVAEAHIFRGSAGDALRLEREHAVVVGFAARLVCKRVGLDSGYAFVCGLLHDIGKPMLMDFLQSHRASELTAEEARLLVDRLHPQFGAHLASHWSLPKLVVEACRRHHAYRDTGARPYSQIGNAIAVADRLAWHQGAGRPQRTLGSEMDRSFYDLGLTPADLRVIIGELEQKPSAA